MIPSSSISLIAAGATDVGLRRNNNEDAFCVDPALHLYIVADGMGGHARGELASQEAINTLQAYLHLYHEDEGLASRPVLESAVNEANATVFAFNRAEALPEGTGMGTALAGVWVPHGSKAWLFHVGDCRVYLWRAAQLRRMTHDHTLYQSWLDHGGEGPAPSKNILLQCLGPNAAVHADIQPVPLESGDTLLICSDGLTAAIDDKDLATLLLEMSTEPLPVACQRLIREANDRGGFDNVSVVLIRVK